MTDQRSENRHPDWVVEDGVRCVVAPCCAFTFDVAHVESEGGGYSCPACAEMRLTAENERLRAALEDIASEDYRGNRPASAVVAERALATGESDA